MRKELAGENEKRKKFRAVFQRFGKKNYKGHTEDTILLNHIVDTETNKMVADHAWFSYTKGFEKIALHPGTALEFEARVKEYRKGYVNKRYKINNRQTDYRFSHPTKIRLISGAD